MHLDSKFILVIGGAGYIGSHTVKSLKRNGYHPIVLDNLSSGHAFFVTEKLKTKLIKGELGNRKLLRDIFHGNHPAVKGKEIGGIIHFAAHAYVEESIKKPLKYYKNNVIDTITLLEEVIAYKSLKKSSYKLPFVFSSSCATYGIPNEIPINENSPQTPINPYGHTKLIIEKCLKDFAKAYNFQSLIFRYFNAAGADPLGEIGELHLPETHLIPLVLKTISGEIDEFRLYGTNYPTRDGTCVRDFIHVSDLADAHVLGLDRLIKGLNINSKYPEIFNLGNGNGYSILDVINTAEQVTGKKLKYKTDKKREGDPPILIASSEKAKRILNWKPKYSHLSKIIKDAWNWEKIKIKYNESLNEIRF